MPPRLAPRVAARLSESEIAIRIRMALAGPHSAGDAAASGAARPGGTALPDTVIWQDAGDEVLVHLASLEVRLAAGTIAVSIDFESDETGRAPVIVRFVFGDAGDRAGLIAATDESPHGDAILAARWGGIFRDAVWASLIRTVSEHALERGAAPQGIVVLDGQVRLRTTPDLPLAERIRREPPPPPRATRPRGPGPIPEPGTAPAPRPPRLVKRRTQ